MNFSDLDFKTLQDIPPLRRYYDIPRVSISQHGRFSLNSALKRQVGDQREFQVKISADGRYLVLYPGGSPNVCFSPKGGDVIHINLAQSLEEKGFLLPVVYTLEWCQEHQAWVGCCQELPTPPALSDLTNPKGNSGRSAARRGT